MRPKNIAKVWPLMRPYLFQLKQKRKQRTLQCNVRLLQLRCRERFPARDILDLNLQFNSAVHTSRLLRLLKKPFLGDERFSSLSMVDKRMFIQELASLNFLARFHWSFVRAT